MSGINKFAASQTNDTAVTLTATETLSNKQIQYSFGNDGATGSNTTLGGFTVGLIRLTGSTLVSLSGIPAGSGGQSLVLENKTGKQITINHEEGTATAGNRIQTSTGGNVVMPNNASFQFFYDSTNTRWQMLGSALAVSGNKNYLSSYNSNPGNGDFELGTTAGWSKANTTLSSLVPNQVSGSWTAASGNMAISAISSSPLAGSWSLQLQQSTGASTSGDMLVSDAFTIDLEDQAKVMTFKAYYSATANSSNLNFSATSANTLQFYIYDVTNSAWIQPAGVYGLAQSSGAGYVTGTFQTTSNSTQYRLAVINVNASAGIYTIVFDDFFLGPQTAPVGAAVTDWQAFTPTGSWTVNTTYSGFWRRNGDFAEIQTYIATGGAPTSASLTVNLPTGLTMDSTKMPALSSVITIPNSNGVANDSGTTLYPLEVVYNSATSVSLRAQLASGTYITTNGQTVTQILPFTFGSGDSVQFSYAVPITGWSSNVLMSNNSDARVVAARAYLSSNQTGVNTNSSAIKVTLNAVDTTYGGDTHNAFNSTYANSYAIYIPGWYDVTASLVVSGANTLANNYQAAIAKNGTIVVYGNSTQNANAGASCRCTASTKVYCVAGDYLDLWVYGTGNNSASTYSISSGNTATVFQVSKILGPSTIAASETVAFFANLATTSIPNTNTATTVINPTVVFDKTGSYNASTGTFTAPISGTYLFTGGFAANAATVDTVNNNIVSTFSKNGVIFSRQGYSVTSTGSYVKSVGSSSSPIYLFAGETVTYQVQSTASSGSLVGNGSTNTFFGGFRIGN